MRPTFLNANLTLTLLLGGALAGCPEEESTPEQDASGSTDAGASDAQGPGEPPRDAATPFVCDVVAPTSCPDPAPKFADVQPIFIKQCGVCHGRDWTGEWPLENYSHIADWQDTIRDELVSCSMPPPDSGVMIERDHRMKILNWIRCGLPR